MKTIKKYIKIIVIGLFLWVSITCVCQSFINPSMTQTEVFLNIPNSFILNFKEWQ